MRWQGHIRNDAGLIDEALAVLQRADCAGGLGSRR
jgi:hypothetical protein